MRASPKGTSDSGVLAGSATVGWGSGIGAAWAVTGAWSVVDGGNNVSTACCQPIVGWGCCSICQARRCSACLLLSMRVFKPWAKVALCSRNSPRVFVRPAFMPWFSWRKAATSSSKACLPRCCETCSLAKPAISPASQLLFSEICASVCTSIRLRAISTTKPAANAMSETEASVTEIRPAPNP